MKYPAYVKYKDCGVEWLSKIPQDWNIKKLKFVALVQPSNVDKKIHEGEKLVRLCNYTDVYYNEEITLKLSFMKASASKEQIEKFTLRSGDTIITKDSEDPNDIAIPAYVPQDIDGVICGYHLAMLRPQREVTGAYLKRVMDSCYARNFFATRANGLTRYGLSTSAIKNFLLPLPSVKEQTQIATFLDRQTAVIDTLIAKQEQLIQLLQEKRQAVICHAVTKGLNPHAPMKDSGIPWLGQIPAHWELTPLKYLCSFQGGGTPTKDNLEYWNGNIPWVSPKDMKTESLIDTQDQITELAITKSSTKLVLQNSLLIVVRSGILQHSIPIAINKIDVTLNQDMKALKFNPKLETLFALNVIKGNQSNLLLEWSKQGATVESIEHEYLANTIFPVPSIGEQREICEYITDKTQKFDLLINAANKAILLLKERRIALISAAVTGKIDVRNHQT